MLKVVPTRNKFQIYVSNLNVEDFEGHSVYILIFI